MLTPLPGGPGPRVEGVAKMAVLRANALGDFIFVLPALEALRAAYPRAEIVLLGQRWHADYLEGRPGAVDRVLALPFGEALPGQPGWREGSQADQFLTSVRAERFDLAVQLHGGGRHSNALVKALDARVTAGLRTPDAPPLDRNLPYVYFQPEILRFLEVVALVGASPVTLVPRLQVTPSDVRESFQVLGDDDSHSSVSPAGAVGQGRDGAPSTIPAGPLVVVHPGAGDARRRWPPAKFAEVIDALQEQAGARVALVGSAGESDLGAKLLGTTKRPAGAQVHDLVGRLSLAGLTGLLSRAQVVVANDSGPLHLAEAVGAATVGIYWCGNLINADPMTRATHRPLLSWQLDCPICGANTIHEACSHDTSFVSEVAVSDVVDSALDLLGAQAA
jgi:ADP-heptose:LPS heptosyltransferase